jgi:hypothetical protein
VSFRHSPLWPNRSIKPPYGAVEIDWGHPLAQGMVVCCIAGVGPIVNLARSAVANATPWPIVSDAYSLTSGRAITVPSLSAMSLGYYGTYGGALEDGTAFFANQANVVNLIASSATNGRFRRNHATSHTSAYTELLQVNVPQCVIGTGGISGADINIFVNGRGRTSSEDNTSGTAPVACTTPVFGASSAGGSYAEWSTSALPSLTQWIAVWDRALIQAEALWLTADPYCFLRPIIRRSYAFVAVGGNTYNETLLIAAIATTSLGRQHVMSCPLTMTAGAAVADGTSMSMGNALTLTSAATTAITGGMALSNALTFTANGATAQGQTLTIPGAVTLQATATETASSIATMLGLLTVTANAPLTAGGSMVMNALASFAAVGTFSATLDAASVYSEAVSFAADAGMAVARQHAMASGVSLTATATQEQITTAVMNALATFAVDARMSGTLGTLITEAVTMAASAGATTTVQQAMANILALQATADLAAVSRMVATNALGLAANAELTNTVTANMTALLSLAVAAMLTGTGALAGLEAPSFIRMVGEAIKTAAMSGEAVKSHGMTGEAIKSASMTGETIQ